MKTDRKRGLFGVCRLEHQRVSSAAASAAAAAAPHTGINNGSATGPGTTAGIPGLYLRVSQSPTSELPRLFLNEFSNVEAHVQLFCRRHDALKRFNGEVHYGSEAWSTLRSAVIALVHDGHEITQGLQQLERLACEHRFRTARRFTKLLPLFTPLLQECQNLLLEMQHEVLNELDRLYASEIRAQRLVA